MLSNIHTHTSFCDGENTPEEFVLYAIDRGFASVGFSGHGNTWFDLRYCMTDTEAYIEEVNRLKQKYSDRIEIYLGCEEDMHAPVERGRFDYIIGSSHYYFCRDKYYPIDSDYGYFKKCIDAADGDALGFADEYYKSFCAYISARKPDIVGHFDLITKFEEKYGSVFLDNEKYWRIACGYLSGVISDDVIFEVNTGQMAKGLRTAPYPHERLLRVLKENNAKLILSSDSHKIETLDYGFEETKKLLRSAGFGYVYYMCGGEFKKEYI